MSTLLQFVVKTIKENAQKREDLSPGCCIASLAAALAIKLRAKNNVVFMACLNMLLASDLLESAEHAVHLVVSAMHSKKILRQFANDVFKKLGLNAPGIDNFWTNGEQLQRSHDHWADLQTDAVNHLLDNAPSGLEDYIKAEKQSWELMLLFGKERFPL
jgi:hypothetical protein